MKRGGGFTLIEVLVAMSVLGLASVALFSLLSRSLFNLRKVEDIHRYQLLCEDLVNRLEVLQTLPAQGSIQGSDLGADWTASISPWYPADLNERPGTAIMRMAVTVSWSTRGGRRTVQMEALKPAKIAYGNYDVTQALNQAIPQ